MELEDLLKHEKAVLIMRGLPGCGKSTLAKKLLDREPHVPGVSISANDYFLRDTGEYAFEVEKLPQAHARCLQHFMRTVTAWRGEAYGKRLIIADNTNTRAVEAAPYYAVAEAYGFTVAVYNFPHGDEFFETLAQRNIHGVPIERIRAMAETLRNETLPPWWNVITHKEQ